MTTDSVRDRDHVHERERTLRCVQDAALDRALTDASVAPRYLAFAGALETARRPADRPRPASETEGAPIADALLASLLVHYGVDRSIADAPDATGRRTVGPSTPPTASGDVSAVDDVREDPRAVGAALAHRRADLGLDRVATLATVTTDAVERALDTVGRTDRESSDRD